VVKTLCPLKAAVAAGTLIPGLTFRRRGQLTILERTPTHKPRRRQPLQANQLALIALQDWWHDTPDQAAWGWDPRNPIMRPTPYHAFIRLNMRRLAAGLHPTPGWPPPPGTAAGNILGPGYDITPNHVRITVNSNSNRRRFWDIVWRTTNWPAQRGHATLAGMWYVGSPLWGLRYWHDNNIPAATWYYWTAAVADDGKPYAGFGWSMKIVPDP